MAQFRERFVIFNGVKGIHEDCNSLQEAKELQLKNLTDYVKNNLMNMFSINKICVSDVGEEWSTVHHGFDDEQVKNLCEQIILNYAKGIINNCVVEEINNMNALKIRQILFDEGIINEEKYYPLKSEI